MKLRKLFFLLFFVSFFQQSWSQNSVCPPNIDFEDGTLNHWDCFIGTTSTNGTANQINLNPSPPTAGRHEVISAATVVPNDEYGGFPKLCPYGGQYSVKLGNNQPNSQAEGISYTFQIPPSADTFSMTYFYAVVFEDPGHPVIEQPRFFVRAYDVLTGALINCASYNYVSSGTIPGFQTPLTHPGVRYKDWTPASIDFSGLAGRTVRIEFKTADCTPGAHFGYAYVDVATGCGGVLAAGAYCIATNNVTLSAPYGFQSYNWFNSNYTTLIGTSRILNLSPPPPVNSLFHVEMIPYPGYGCKDTADAQLTVLPVPDTPVAVTNIYYCQSDIANALSAQALPGGYELIWYNSAAGGVPANIAPIPSTSTPGTVSYYVSQKTLHGCESIRKQINIIVSVIPVVAFTINNNRQCESTNNFIFTSTSTNTTPGTTYLWDFGDGTTATTPVANHSYIGIGTRQVTLKVFNNATCVKQLTKQVTIVGKPVASFNYTNLICENQTPIILTETSVVPSGTGTVSSWWWKIGNNVVTVRNPAPFTYAGGVLPVSLVAYTVEGCRSDTTTILIPVHYSPVPSFTFSALHCENELLSLFDRSTMPSGAQNDTISTWSWSYDGQPSSTLQNPSGLFTPGVHMIKLVVTSDKGCNYRSADSMITIYAKPSVSMLISDSCVRRNIAFTAMNNSPYTIARWLWDFGPGFTQNAATVTKTFLTNGFINIGLIAQTTEGCKDTITRPFTIYMNKSKATMDSVAATDQIVQLNSGDTTNVIQYLWTPPSGLNDTHIFNPTASYHYDTYYELNTLTLQGCESYSKIFIKRYDGPELYVPNAFSPNKDGLNDQLKVIPTGIHTFKYFMVFSRGGQKVFSTENYHIGWDGTFKGALLERGNYVWMAMGIDYKGRTIFRKGNVLLLR